MTGRAIIAVFAFSVLGLTAHAAGPDGVAAAVNHGNANVGFEEKIGAQVPLDTVFRDEEEKPITLREAFEGKPTILVLAYYRCPQLCTMVLNDLLDALRKMPPDFTAGQKFNVVTVSFDPKEHADLASEKRKAYLGNYGRENANWRFLTGTKESIAEFTQAVGFKYEFDRAFKEYNHPSGLIVVTPDGHTSRYFLGLGYGGEYENKAKTETTTLRMSLVEASDGKLGSLMDRMWLSCYRFDHSTKKYSPTVMGIVRIAGIITVMMMAVAVFMFVRFDRRKRLVAASPAISASHPAGGQSGVQV